MDEKKSQRMTGWALQLAARLMETKGTGGLLYGKATEQIGIEKLHGVHVPKRAGLYWHSHLVPAVVKQEGLVDDD